MADTHSSAPSTQVTHGAHGHAAHGSDMMAAFAGLVIGAIALFLILGSIVLLTNRHYANERGGEHTAQSAER